MSGYDEQRRVNEGFVEDHVRRKREIYLSREHAYVFTAGSIAFTSGKRDRVFNLKINKNKYKQKMHIHLPERKNTSGGYATALAIMKRLRLEDSYNKLFQPLPYLPSNL